MAEQGAPDWEMFDRAKEGLQRYAAEHEEMLIPMSVDAYKALPDPQNITFDDLLDLMEKGLL